MSKQIDRARGVMLGQLCGDALGTTVEFSDPATIARQFPGGLRELIGGGPFGVLAGQITDDSELALSLARCLADHGWSLDARARAYASWYHSKPFDVGNTTALAFGGWGAEVTAEAMFARAAEKNGAPNKQANGALMRISPLAIYGARFDRRVLIERAKEDARFSHPSPVCQAANAAFVAAIQLGLRGGTREEGLAAAREATDEAAIHQALDRLDTPPVCHGGAQGWVIVAFQNAFHRLMHEASFEDALVHTVMAGGDTDTNACIAGALLGAFHGMSSIPRRWIERVLSCRTDRGPAYQTADALDLADALVIRGTSDAGVMTSASHPLRVDWLDEQTTRGKVGLTIAPGKMTTSKSGGGRWQRDLDDDLETLAKTWGIQVLVCLLEDGDLQRLGIAAIVERARACGMEVIRFPITDTATPRSSVDELVKTIRDRAEAGKNVVIHCEGGLGRSGTIGGCYLAQFGHSADAILDNLRRSRKSIYCPENEHQRQFIRDFRARLPAEDL